LVPDKIMGFFVISWNRFNADEKDPGHFASAATAFYKRGFR